jgi:hypothetical protein
MSTFAEILDECLPQYVENLRSQRLLKITKQLELLIGPFSSAAYQRRTRPTSTCTKSDEA